MPRTHSCGIYRIECNAGFINLGASQDTGAGAVTCIRGWGVGDRRFHTKAKEILITVDDAGGCGHPGRLHNFEVQKFTDQTRTLPLPKDTTSIMREGNVSSW